MKNLKVSSPLLVLHKQKRNAIDSEKEIIKFIFHSQTYPFFRLWFSVAGKNLYLLKPSLFTLANHQNCKEIPTTKDKKEKSDLCFSWTKSSPSSNWGCHEDLSLLLGSPSPPSFKLVTFAVYPLLPSFWKLYFHKVKEADYDSSLL